MSTMREPQDQIEIEIKKILDQLEADKKNIYEKYSDFTGLDGSAAKASRELTRKAFCRIAEIKKRQRNKI